MFFIDSVKAPQWKLYNKEDGDHIEEGYQIFLRDKTKGNHPVNATFSVGYNKSYKAQYTKATHTLMIQYRTNSPTAFRPAIRAVYAWFWNKSDDENVPIWEPYPLEISELLESALLRRETEVCLPSSPQQQQQQCAYVVNLLDMAQCRADARFYKRDVRRAGTAISESHYTGIFARVMAGREAATPSYWAPMADTHGTVNVPLESAEGAAIAEMMNRRLVPLPYYGTVAGIYDSSTGFQLPSAYFEVVGIHRLQDRNIWADYLQAKLLTASKYGDGKLQGMVCTKELHAMKLVQHVCDRRSNEYYFWYGCDRAVANQIVCGTNPDGSRIVGLPGQGPIFVSELSCKANLDIDCPVCMKGSPTTNIACSCRERNVSNPYVMFLCRVVLGNCCKKTSKILYLFAFDFVCLCVCVLCCTVHFIPGKSVPGVTDPLQLLTKCPVDPATTKPYDSVITDSPALGSKETFRTIVIYNRTQVYPEYAVYYYRGEYDPNMQ